MALALNPTEVNVMTIKTIMLGREVARLRPDDNLGLAIQMMLWSHVRHLPVVRDGEVVGVLSERDVLRRSTEVGARAARLEPVECAMTAPAITIAADKPLAEAAWLMSGRKLGCLPVMDGGRLCGMVTTTDLLRHQFEDEAKRELALGSL
jgi:CBS domain-containing protein